VAVWFAVISRLLSNTADGWNPFSDAVRRLSLSVLAVGMAGLVYVMMGGTVGLPFAVPSDFSAFAAAATIYVVVLRGVGAMPEAVRTGRFRDWLGPFRTAAVLDLFMIPFAGLLALMQVEIGSLAVGLFLLPLLFARYAIKLWIDTRRGHIDTVRTLMQAVDAGDVFTRGHATRISRISVRVARYLGLPEREIEDIEYAALLHDFGRTAMARDILTKAGKLNDLERAELRAHPTVGSDLIKDLGLFPGAGEIVLDHHEQPDGKGYPRGLTGESIPMGSRIIMVAAAFDAMTSERPYRHGLDPESAFEELLGHSGTQFFPEVVEALIHLYGTEELFDEFEESELLEYANEDSTSRAMEVHVSRVGIAPEIPQKLGGGAFGGPDVIEMPDLDEPAETVTGVFPLGEGLEVSVAGASDLGCLRGNNEDSFGLIDLEDRGSLLVLADGMGGAAAGEVASAMAVDTLRQTIVTEEADADGLRRAMVMANQEIHNRSGEDANCAGMGTTCTAALLRDGGLTVAHVGDSRAYLIVGGQVNQLTRDHTLAVELERMTAGGGGSVNVPSSVLTRCLGVESSVDVDLVDEPVALAAGDTLVLCSDGLSNLVSPEEIADSLADRGPEAACFRMIELARERGGPDNITVIAARVQGR